MFLKPKACKRRIPLGLFLSALATTAWSADEPLKVCAAANEMPYSNEKQEGFENKVAEIIADGLNRPLEYVWWQDPRYFVRDYLDKGLCDVTMGVDAGDPRLATTRSYYRSGYVFVSRQKDQLELNSWDSKDLHEAKQIAFIPSTPAEVMIRKIGRYNDNFNYMHSLVGFKSRRNQYVKFEASKLVSEVKSGNADVAVLWGPSAARYVNQSDGALRLDVIPDNNQRDDGEPVPHHYSSAIGVRKDDTALRDQIDQVLQQKQQAITAVLKSEGIPLIPDDKQAIASNGPH